MDNKYYISDSLLKSFFDFKTTPEQTAYILEAVNCDPEIQERYLALEREEARKDRVGRALPLENMAAAGEDNLCDVLCEEFILKTFAVNTKAQEMFNVAERNTWVRESGTPLFNMGRILEANGMSVTRRYDCTFEDIQEALSRRTRVIAVVDYGMLKNGESDDIFHAIVCMKAGELIMDFYDPAVGEIVHYSTELFDRAWEKSRRYMVCATTDQLVYEPHPVDLSDVELDPELMDLVEIIAENLHDVWGVKRRDKHYVYGPIRDETACPPTSPDWLPYCDLPDEEKQIDRDNAIMALRLAKKLGFYVSRPGSYKCSCGGAVSFDMAYCPTCGKKLTFDDFFK